MGALKCSNPHTGHTVGRIAKPSANPRQNEYRRSWLPTPFCECCGTVTVWYTGL